MAIFQILRDIMGIVSFLMGIFLFIKFYAISKVIDKRALAMVKQLKTMFGSELVNKRIQGKDLLKIQRKNRAIIGKTLKKKIPFVLDDIPDKDVVASFLDRDLMAGTFFLLEKVGGGVDWLKKMITGEREGKKRSGFQFE